MVAYALVGLAEVALARLDAAAALPYAERATAIRERGEVMPGELAQARFLVARALARGGASAAPAGVLPGLEQRREALAVERRR